MWLSMHVADHPTFHRQSIEHPPILRQGWTFFNILKIRDKCICFVLVAILSFPWNARAGFRFVLHNEPGCPLHWYLEISAESEKRKSVVLRVAGILCGK